MTRPTNVIDYADPDSNLFGLLPCPQCDSRFRYVTSAGHPYAPETILCGCGFKEKPVEVTKEQAK